MVVASTNGSLDESLVALLRQRPTMVERLLSEHIDDGTGRCSKCSAGAQTGRYRFPCLIRMAVDEAVRLLQNQPDPDSAGTS